MLFQRRGRRCFSSAEGCVCRHRIGVPSRPHTRGIVEHNTSRVRGKHSLRLGPCFRSRGWPLTVTVLAFPMADADASQEPARAFARRSQQTFAHRCAAVALREFPGDGSDAGQFPRHPPAAALFGLAFPRPHRQSRRHAGLPLATGVDGGSLCRTSAARATFFGQCCQPLERLCGFQLRLLYVGIERVFRLPS